MHQVISVLLTLCVGASMGEVVSAYPTSGGMYFSSYMLAPPRWRGFAAWTTGWFNLLGEGGQLLCWAGL
jgi:amino acid transporter